jgi:hypothetical protein
MKKILSLAVIFLVAGSAGYSQSKSFDIASFNPPPGWSKGDKGGARTYTVVDNAKRAYGIIAIYPSVTSSGSAQKDFTSTWNGLVKPSFEAGMAPMPSAARQQEGYEGLQGTSYGLWQGKQSTITLVNYTGGGKTISIVMNYTDFFYEAAMNKFLESLRLKSAGK